MASIFLNRRLSTLTNLTYRLKVYTSPTLSSSTSSISHQPIKQISSSSTSNDKYYFNNNNQLWSDSNWSQFGKVFNRINDFPLPGQIGLIKSELNKQQQQQQQQQTTAIKQQTKESIADNLDELLYKPLPTDTHINTIMQAVGQQKELNNEINEKEFSTNKNNLELKAYKCPKSLLMDFKNCFPSKNDEIATVITVSLKTDNDMSMYSNDIEEEREFLMKKFIDIAQNVCLKLKNEGHWVDFIDPCSGRPSFGAFTHATFYETDERYRQFGFEIVDYGCCKVISHHKWGTKSYVGSILTSAKHDSDLVRNLVQHF